MWTNDTFLVVIHQLFQAWGIAAFHSNIIQILWKISSLTADPHCEARLYCIKFVNTKVYSNIFNCACSCILHLRRTPALIHTKQNEKSFYFHYRDQQNRKYFGALALSLCQSSGCEQAGGHQIALSLNLALLPSLLTRSIQTNNGTAGKRKLPHLFQQD